MGLAACGSEGDSEELNGSGGDGLGGDGSGGTGGDDSIPSGGNAGADSSSSGGDGNEQGGAGGDAPATGGATEGSGGDVGTGGDGNLPFKGLYIGVDGNDGDDGTMEAPFATLTHAASVAVAGDTIVFLGGNFTMPIQAVTIPDGVDVMAHVSATSFLSGNGALFNLMGDTRITGLDLENFTRPIQFVGAAAAMGTVTIEDTRFESCSQACLTLSGATKAVVLGQGEEPLADGGGAFAILTETSSLSMTEGLLENFQAGGLIRAEDESTVSLTDITVDGGTGVVLTLRNEASGIVEGATIATLSASLLQQFDQSVLTVRGSDLSMKGGTPFNCVTTSAMNKLTIESSKLHDCGTGIKGGPPAELTVIDTEFYNLDFGTETAAAGGAVTESTILINGCNLHDIAYSALRLGGATNKINVKIRDTLVDVSTFANWGAVILTGTNASEIDLGTLDDPGGNTFLQGNTTTAHTALQLNLAALTVFAVGNTWTPHVQGADANGLYAVVAGNLLEDSTSASGRNYLKPQATTTIRLAQIP